MKLGADTLLDTIGDIDDELISDAQNAAKSPRHRRHTVIRWSSAACLAVAIIICTAFIFAPGKISVSASGERLTDKTSVVVGKSASGARVITGAPSYTEIAFDVSVKGTTVIGVSDGSVQAIARDGGELLGTGTSITLEKPAHILWSANLTDTERVHTMTLSCGDEIKTICLSCDSDGNWTAKTK